MRIREALFAFVLGCGAAHAQTPSPADVGIVKGPTNTFQVLDTSGAWSTFGYVDPITHVFTPVGGGGGGGGGTPGGAAGSIQFNSSGAFGGYANPLPIINRGQRVLTSPSGADRWVQWSRSTGSFPNQTAFPLQGGGGGGSSSYPLLVTAPSIGMVSGGADNSPHVAALMSALGGPSQGGYEVVFPPVYGQNFTPYYFSNTIDASRARRIFVAVPVCQAASSWCSRQGGVGVRAEVCCSSSLQAAAMAYWALRKVVRSSPPAKASASLL